MRLDFICPGLGRCGTTTLNDILRQYSEIKLPNIKEPIYLQDYETSKNGVEWYQEKYYGINEKNPQDSSKKYGEINPSFGCISSRRLRDTFGEEVKIIIMLRNPVIRLCECKDMLYEGGYGEKLVRDVMSLKENNILLNDDTCIFNICNL